MKNKSHGLVELWEGGARNEDKNIVVKYNRKKNF